MKVSIILPVYNVEKYVAKCLESIMKQSLDDFECLIIDDGSKDQSIDIISNIIKDDIRFTIYHKENGGLSDARNYGLDLAIGDYISFVDSDDYIDEKMLEKAYNKALEYDSDIVCFDLFYEYEDGHLERCKGANKEISNYQEDKDLIFIVNSANNKLFKRNFIKDKRFIKGIWYEDLASIPIWLAKANNVSYVEEALYYYLQRNNSISHSYDERIFDIYKAIDNIKKELSLNSEDVKELYLKHSLIATTLRIKMIKDPKIKKEYYKKNMELLNANYKDWYKDYKKEKKSFGWKIVFYLLKKNNYGLLNIIYR